MSRAIAGENFKLFFLCSRCQNGPQLRVGAISSGEAGRGRLRAERIQAVRSEAQQEHHTQRSEHDRWEGNNVSTCTKKSCLRKKFTHFRNVDLTQIFRRVDLARCTFWQSAGIRNAYRFRLLSSPSDLSKGWCKKGSSFRRFARRCDVWAKQSRPNTDEVTELYPRIPPGGSCYGRTLAQERAVPRWRSELNSRAAKPREKEPGI